MKEKILELRNQGKNYKEIVEILGCAKSTVAYYCSSTQKLKSSSRQRKRRQANVLLSKVEKFKSRNFSEKTRNFQRREGSKLISRKEYNFTSKELLQKIGQNPRCYLSGKPIDLQNGKDYHLDHIIPASKGGKNTLDNADILNATINKMKHDLYVEDFIKICKEILEYQGFTITKESKPDRVSGATC